jgi:citronellol/citronellal dehydrogenase
VIGCGRRPEPLEEMVATVEEGGGRAEARPMDIRDDDAVEALFDGVMERHGRLDLLVNNAGGQFLSPAEAISPKGFRTVIDLNVNGTWLMTHAAATKAFIPQGRGKVLSITLSPHNGMPGMVHSGAARAAVENMMRTLSVEWARFGIKLVALAAGQFGTETMRTKYPPEVVAAVPGTVPLGRLGTEEEMAWLIAYLASPAGDFFSGTVITLDGARDNWFGSWPPGPGEPPAESRKP